MTCTTSPWMVDWDRNRAHCSTYPTKEVQIIMERAPYSIPMLLNIFIEYHGYYVDVLRMPSPFQSHLVWPPLGDHGGGGWGGTGASLNNAVDPLHWIQTHQKNVPWGTELLRQNFPELQMCSFPYRSHLTTGQAGGVYWLVFAHTTQYGILL